MVLNVRRLTAQDVLETFLNGVDKLDLQVASDGPNVNLLFLKSVVMFREEKKYLLLVDIGTCGLHVVHVSLKTLAHKGTDWDIQKLLKPMWQFLHEAPVQRALYISESLDYPVKICTHRWVQNENCAARAESLLYDYRKFITHICSLKKVSNLIAKTKNFTRLKSMVRDTFLAAKLKFSEIVAGKMDSFLRGF